MARTVITETSTTVSKVSKTVDKVDLTKDAAGVEKALAAFIFAKDAIKSYEEKKAAAEAQLREFLGDAEVAMIGGVERFKLASRVNTSIDRKELQAGWPEAFEATLKKTPYDFIQTL